MLSTMTRRGISFSIVFGLGVVTGIGCSQDVVSREQPAAVAQVGAQGDECIYAPSPGEQEHPCPHDARSATPVLRLADGPGHHGEAFTLTDARPLSSVVERDELVQVSGVIDSVCQKKGCWMVLRDGENYARVLMKHHAFAVPVDSRGKSAKVEGVLTSREFTAAQVAHLERDAGHEPGDVASRTELVLTATGVEIQSS